MRISLFGASKYDLLSSPFIFSLFNTYPCAMPVFSENNLGQKEISAILLSFNPYNNPHCKENSLQMQGYNRKDPLCYVCCQVFASAKYPGSEIPRDRQCELLNSPLPPINLRSVQITSKHTPYDPETLKVRFSYAYQECLRYVWRNERTLH